MIFKTLTLILIVAVCLNANPLTRNKRALGTTKDRRWPNGVIPFEIAANTYTKDQLKNINRAMEIISQRTQNCVQFKPRQSHEFDFISIKSNVGCHSSTGKDGGLQTVSLEKGDCTHTAVAVHELMHAIGFNHEQNRDDRDKYIKVFLKNVDPNARDQFKKQGSNYYGTSYDLKSIMHYGEHAFSYDGESKTMTALNGQKLISAYKKPESDYLSETDIKAIKTMYECTGPKQKVEVTTQAPIKAGVSFEFIVDNDHDKTVTLYSDNNGKLTKKGDITAYNILQVKSVTGAKWVVKGQGLTDKKFTVGSGAFRNAGDFVPVSLIK